MLLSQISTAIEENQKTLGGNKVMTIPGSGKKTGEKERRLPFHNFKTSSEGPLGWGGGGEFSLVRRSAAASGAKIEIKNEYPYRQVSRMRNIRSCHK